MQATNSFCISLLSYGFGVISWTKPEITKFDRLVRQVMTAANCHRPRSAIERLHLPRKLGGRGLLCVEHFLEHRIIMLSHHLQKSEDALVKMRCTLDSQLPPHGSIVSRASSLVSSLSFVNDFLHYSPGQLRAAVCSAQQRQLLDCLCANLCMVRKFFSWIHSADVSIAKNFQWLQQSLHSESESTLFAIQDQAICTRVYQARIIGSPISSIYILCCLCGEHEETIQHILAGCSALAPTCYLSHHNM